MGEPIIVDRRFCGPPDAGNGGYVAGLLAERVGGGAEVTLRRPIPLEAPLGVRVEGAGAGARWILENGEGLIAEARAGQLAMDVPLRPSYEEAEAARERGDGKPHPFPGCFVCGPHREEGDGLCIFPGTLPGQEGVACPWIPDDSIVGDDGRVAPAFLWAALDCPGGIAAMQIVPGAAVLGRMSATIEHRPLPGERCVAVGWRIAQDGRKHEAGTAIFDEAGRLCGRSHQVWIVLKEPGES